MNESGFQLLESRPIASLNLEFQAYRHGATGARHYHLASDDDNNAFMVAFPTLPADSTGVAHILEHTTLCGSLRFPVRDPFFMMLRRSLNTFMNAFTSSDSTVYPFATRNRKDFDNLLEVYLDAVFFPRLDPLDFAQEGCRIEFADGAGPAAALTYKGVVYNEMKGAMSSAVAQLWHHLQAALFPDTPYRHNSGGDPAEIPALTHAALQAFHARHYHPSQAVFMTYGNFDPHEHQAKFATLALDRFAARSDIIVSVPQPPFPAPRAGEFRYAVDDPADVAAGTHLVWGWLLGESSDPASVLEAHLLAGILLEHSASPLRHYLETTECAKAPSELCGIDDSARQLAFYCGVEGTDPVHIGTLEAGVLEVIGRVARDGVDPATVAAVIDRIEMAQRDIGGDGYPYGLQLMSRALPGAMYRRDPAALLAIDDLVTALRARVADPGFVRDLTQRYLVDNLHRVCVTMIPDPAKRQREREVEQARLQALAAKLDDTERARIATDATRLAERQAQAPNADLLPKVTLADVPLAEPLIEGTQDSRAGRATHSYVRGTNGLMHVQLALTMPELPPAELVLMPLFANYLTELGCGTESYLEVQTRRARVGQIAASATVRSLLDDANQGRGHFVMSGKGLKRKADALVTTVFELLEGVRLDEGARLRDLLAQTRVDVEMGLVDRGHHLALHGAARGLTRIAGLTDLWDGPGNVQALQALEEAVRTDDAALARLQAGFANLRSRLLAAPCRVLLVGESDALEAGRITLDRVAPPAAAIGFAPFVLNEQTPASASAWLINGEVNFCAKSYLAVSEGHPDAPALAVLARYLSDGFLHPAIREKGGAYGGGASFDSDSGVFGFYSYRDPRLEETLSDFDRALQWLQEPQEAARLEESILGVIRGLDKPRSPAGAAIHAFYSLLNDRTPAFRARYRAAVLATTLEQLRAAAARYLEPARAAIGVVTHAGERGTIDALGLTAQEL